MLIDKFEKQVAKSPGNIAIKYGEQEYTYAQLNAWANRIAQLITKYWPASQDSETLPVVGLLLEHGPQMIAAILGTLKAGKAYVPIATDYPPDRAAYMLSNSGAALVLTSREYWEKALEAASQQQVAIDCITIDEAGNCDGSQDPQREIQENRVAYIMYTSGSTGWPKGVVQTHRNAEYYVHNWTRIFSITQEDRMTLFSSFCHDGSVQDMFAALHSGATLYPFDMRRREKSIRLSDFLVEEKITIWHSVPSLFTFFCGALSGGHEFKDLRFILLGGEAVREHEVEVFKKFFPYSTLANVYGQTESSVNSICLIKQDDIFKKSLIGQPLDETQVFVVDKEGEEVDTLQTGEILVASRYISPGYWQNEEESAKAFKDNETFGRLYWTGDQGRLLLDGNIEFLGRQDNQVKIRGYRVEVGEIETRLFRHEKVKAAVVLAKTNETGETYLCAYVVPVLPARENEQDEVDIDGIFTVSEMRDYLAREVPGYMIPSYLVCLEKFPLTQSNKIDRRALPEPKHIRPTLDVSYVAPRSNLEEKITAAWKEALQLEQVGVNDNFFDLGGTSFDILKVTGQLTQLLGREVPVVSLFRYPTISSFVEHLEQEEAISRGETGSIFTSKNIQPSRRTQEVVPPIAVIGMAGRFPGAKNIQQFWDNLKQGAETITYFYDEELLAQGVDPQLLENPDYVKANALLEDIEYFDASFFGYSPVEAGLMDPQLRILHEVCWEALEDAGYAGDTGAAAIGAYCGNAANQYWVSLTYMHSHEGLDAVFLNSNYSTKVSYKLNLTGPSFVVSTACSTSLVAVHLACRGIIDGECDMALAGGISITLPDKEGYLYRKGMILSADGHCRAFDAQASGTVFGNGVGMVLLKKLDDAIADGDTISAIIKGTAINNDGSRKVGLAAPSVEGQAEVIRAAQAAAGVTPESIGYIETHGTGTLLGDPIEIEALSLAFGTEKKGYCAVGSVKTNIGHLNTASGIAGFIKTVLVLKHGLIPASINFETPNPKIDFENSPFYVNTQLKEWGPSTGPDGNLLPLRAGLNSFGVGGTNAHAILEAPQGPPITPSAKKNRTEEGVISLDDNTRRGLIHQTQAFEVPAPPHHLFLLSAKTPGALERMTQNLVEFVQAEPGIDLGNVAYTLQVGRKTFKFRRKYLCHDVAGLVANLAQAPVFESAEERSSVIFMFSGQGSQYVDMGRGLYESIPYFRKQVDACFEILEKEGLSGIKDMLFPGISSPGASSTADADQINQTKITQPVIFTIEYALARLLMYWGIKPYAMTGHSIGEYVAACISGVFSLADALKLVLLRGQLMQELPGGDMLSVPLPEKELLPLLDDSISLAAVNSPGHCVVSGPGEAIAAFAKKMQAAGHAVRELHTSHAFHSMMMEPILDKFTAVVRETSLNKPTIPYVSNLTGTWIGAEDAVDPTYWARHIREAVRFNDGMVQLLEADRPVFLEIGPGRALATFARQHRNNQNKIEILQLMRHPKEEIDDHAFLMERLGQLWVHDVKIDWDNVHKLEIEKETAPQDRSLSRRRHYRQRISLPTYPFQRQRFWLEGDPRKMGQESPAKAMAKKEKRELSEWFYVPTWTPAPLPPAPAAGEEEQPPVKWLFFMDDQPLMENLSKRLAKDHGEVLVIRPGAAFASTGEGGFTVNPGSSEDFSKLLQQLELDSETVLRIVHTWNVTGANPAPTMEETINRGFYSLLALAQALGKAAIKNRVEISAITDGVQAVEGDNSPVTAPGKATIHGAIQVIPREFPNIRCRTLDIPSSLADQDLEEQTLAQLTAELDTWTGDIHVAYRDNQRWQREFKAERINRIFHEPALFKQNGVYLITGGLGGIGIVLGRYLAGTFAAKLILTGRSHFPARAEWADYLANHDEAEPRAQKIRSLLEWEGYGAQVVVSSVDVADKEGMKHVIEQAEQQFGPIDGVIHSAGIADGALIQLRNKEMSESVFAPKIQGTLILEELLQDRQLDFFVFCSSISAVLAPFGQAAYCAANAYLDAFAAQHAHHEKTRYLSINWDNWQETGMAYNATLQQGATASQGGPAGTTKQGTPIEHDLFDRVETQDNKKIYYADLTVASHWLLDEHRIAGKATLPGTGYLELARSAFAEYQDVASALLSNVYFLVPLTIADDETITVRVTIEKQEKDFSFSIASPNPDTGQGNQQPGQWREHACGQVALLTGEETRPVNSLDDIRAACSGEETSFDPQAYDGRSGAMTFGPRWNSLQQLSYQDGHGLGHLQLPAAYHEDLTTYPLHPALMDVATTILRARLKEEEKGAYIPFSYKKLRIFAPLSGDLFVYAREIPQAGATSASPANNPSETLQYDVTVMQPSGEVLVDIEGFTLKLVKLEGSQPKELAGLTAPLLAVPSDEENYYLAVLDGAATGRFDNLEYRPTQRIAPGPGEVEIEIFAAGLNFKEVLRVLGTIGPVEPGTTFGMECAGKITAVGEGVEEFAPGDPVLTMGKSCFSRYMTVSSRLVIRKPANLSFEQAAAIPVAFMTAYYGLIKLGRLRENEKVLIHSAAGGVGLAAVEVARHAGAEIFATAGNHEKRVFLRSLGIEYIMNSRTLDFADEIMKYTDGRGVDVVLNSLASDFIPKSMSVLAPQGRFIEIGIRDILNNTGLELRPFIKGLSYSAFQLTAELYDIDAAWVEILRNFANGSYQPLPLSIFPTAQTAQAFEFMTRGVHTGKLVVSHTASTFYTVAAPAAALSRASDDSRQAQEKALANGILSSEGVEVFRRLAAQPGSSQVVVSTTDFFKRLERAGSVPGIALSTVESGASTAKYSRPELSTAYQSPATAMEKQLAVIWQDLLGLDKVGINDDFFELGGDSLKAVTFGGRIHKETGVEVALTEFFSRPTVKQLAEYLEEAGTSGTGGTFIDIETVEDRDNYALSPAQERLFILQEMDKSSTGYNLPTIVRLLGKLDKEKFETSIYQLVERHESLRTSFHLVNGQPVQKIQAPGEIQFTITSPGPAAQPQTSHSRTHSLPCHSSEFIIHNFVRPFDLAKAPLLRVGLLQQAEDNYLFMLDVHHIVCDGSSTALFFKDFIDIYSGKTPSPLKLRYRDYSEWVNSAAMQEQKKKQENYWVQRFAGEIPVIDLPLDFERPVVQSFEGGTVRFVIDEKDTAALKDAGGKADVTLFMILLGLFDVLFMKISGQEDIVIGTPTAGRGHTDLENVIGMFVNTLALRNFPEAGKTFKEFLKEVKSDALAAFGNQDFQFEELVEKVDVRRDAARNPLFDIMFRMLNVGASAGTVDLEIEGLKLKSYEFDPGTAIFDLDIAVTEADQRLHFFINYCSKLFKKETIDRFVDYFRRLVRGIPQQMEQQLGQIEIISPQEKEQILVEFNDTAREYPRDKTVIQLFEEQVERTPDQLAVSGPGARGSHGAHGAHQVKLTYQQFHQEILALARRLAGIGLAPGRIAGCIGSRYIEMLTGLFAIIKTGAAYVPIDPGYPGERINYILEHSEAEILLAINPQAGLDDQVIELRDGQDPEKILSEPAVAGEIETAAGPGDPLYLIYTSGTTGIPKGVVIENRAMVNFITGITDIIPFVPGDRVLSLTTAAFDIFGLETTLSLTKGVQVILGSEEEQVDAGAAARVITREKVSIFQVTPSRLQLFVGDPVAASSLGYLKYLLVGGEALPPVLLEQVRPLVNGKIYNMYGPTETTIWSTVKDVSAGETLNIGKPIANTQIYILGTGNTLQPIGVTGELCIAGDGLARGYYKDETLTNEKFTRCSGTSSLITHHSSLLYRTGDLARWLPGGNIQCLGRIDHQVKIRGFRIECGEIESRLTSHEKIEDAVVIDRKDDSGEKYLCAYIILREAGQPAKEDEAGEDSARGLIHQSLLQELREYLAQKLPDYMIPAYFVRIDSVPLSPNGKVDRKALPMPETSRPVVGATYVEPSPGNEKLLAEIWQEVLKVDQVGIDDNFFELGGSSLKIVQLSRRLSEVLEKEIPVASMFRYPTIRSLLKYLSDESVIEVVSDEEIDASREEMEETMQLFLGDEDDE